jgi:ribonuclease T1
VKDIEGTMRRLLFCCVAILSSLALPSATLGEGSEAGAGPGPAMIAVAQLPLEARQTLHLIDQGGPFPYSRDGIVFGNREGRLPRKQYGYYHEYTVPTPGSHDRGARRIIAGRVAERYYTDNHYRSFKRIVE